MGKIALVLIIGLLLGVVLGAGIVGIADALWGDVATWVTGITTIALFVIGFWQIRIERVARLKAEDERLSAIGRYQAERVAAWIAGEGFDDRGQVLCVAISNQSLQPIYHVVVLGIVLFNDGTPLADPSPDNQARIAVVPPGEGFTAIQLNYAGMHRRAGVEIAFQDAANRYWLRRTNGELIELPASPVVHYDIPQPAGWDMLQDECPERG
jgi:hypothetical protein